MNTILQTFRDRLAAAGLVVETLEADGALHRCGTADNPRDLDGAYKAHLDEPATLWWKNWRTGDEGTHTLKAEKEMSRAERKALKERIEAARRGAEAERAGRFAAAAARASQIWSLAPPATDAHPYLRRKGVRSFGLRVAPDGRLIVPVLDAFDDRGDSLQYIAANGEKRFLSGGKTAGGCFWLRAKDSRVDGPLLICEGYATAASLRMATGHAVVMAFNAGNLESVARAMRQRFPERELVLCADNDEGERPDGTPCNVGADAARKAAVAVGGKLAICPLINGRKADFNDLHLAQGVDAVREAVEAARNRKQGDGCIMPEGYYLVSEGRGAGLYKEILKPDGDSTQIRLGPPLFVRGMTRDDDGNDWGVMLEWYDPDERLHSWPLPLDLLSKQGGEWFGVLANGGWFGAPGTRSKLCTFLQTVRHSRHIICVNRVGWHESAYVLPNAVYGTAGGADVVLQSYGHAKLYGTAGTLDGWKEAAALAVGNSRLTFALCLAFAGPLLRLTGTEGGGFSLEGDSSCGKTTALQLAASVWGGPDHVRTWRATDNGLEGVAALHNDSLLILDEIGQVGGRVLAEAAYMLANGSGKTRAAKDNNYLRRSLTWRLLFLSSGEVGLADKLTEAGLRKRAGQEVRLAGVPVSREHTARLHGLPDAGALANRIKTIAAAHYGHAGRAFLDWLTRDVEASRREALALVELWTASLLTACPDADGQVKRVARRFALGAAAGILARDRAGVLPENMDAGMAVTACFRSWLEERGGAGASEDAAILAQVRLFIEQHGASRFQDMDTEQTHGVINRVGFRRKAGDTTEFLILPESFRAEVVKGFSPRRAAAVLRKEGWLRMNDGKSSAVCTLPGMGQRRVYAVALPDERGTD